jgi:hypothetical protein
MLYINILGNIFPVDSTSQLQPVRLRRRQITIGPREPRFPAGAANLAQYRWLMTAPARW